MSRLSQAEIKKHETALALIALDRPLIDDDIIDIIENFHEAADHNANAHSAFFTPWELAMSFAIACPSGGKIIDLAAGIGTLSAAVSIYHRWNPGDLEFTLVELNPTYAKIAQRLLPDARVIVGSIFDPMVQAQINEQHYDFAISNPPFGNAARASGSAPRYGGSDLAYSIIDIASDIADAGAFILPQGSVPFKLSGQDHYEANCNNNRYQLFHEQTKIGLHGSNCIDTAFARNMWRGTKIATEIVDADFVEARARRNPQPAPITVPAPQKDPATLAVIASEPGHGFQPDLFANAA